MKVSILTVTYNHEAFIEQSVRSVLSQVTSFPIELVIGEDRSTDSTRSLIEGLAREYPEIIRLNLQARNLGPALNFIDTFQKCKGKYIALLDGDDYWTCPEKLERQVQFLEQNPAFAACFHNVEVHESGKEPRLFCGPDQSPVVGLEDLVRHNPVPALSIVFRNHLFSEFPAWFEECPVSDSPLHMLTATHGKFSYFNAVMGVYRIHAGSVHGKAGMEHDLRCKAAVLEKVGGYFGPQIERVVRRTLTRRHYSLALSSWDRRAYWTSLEHALKTIISRPLLRNLDWKLKMIARMTGGGFLSG